MYDRKVKTRQTSTGAREEPTRNDRGGENGGRGESKLELFGFDSLVNILGLKRYKLFLLVCMLI